MSPPAALTHALPPSNTPCGPPHNSGCLAFSLAVRICRRYNVYLTILRMAYGVGPYRLAQPGHPQSNLPYTGLPLAVPSCATRPVLLALSRRPLRGPWTVRNTANIQCCRRCRRYRAFVTISTSITRTVARHIRFLPTKFPTPPGVILSPAPALPTW